MDENTRYLFCDCSSRRDLIKCFWWKHLFSKNKLMREVYNIDFSPLEKVKKCEKTGKSKFMIYRVCKFIKRCYKYLAMNLGDLVSPPSIREQPKTNYGLNKTLKVRSLVFVFLFNWLLMKSSPFKWKSPHATFKCSIVQLGFFLVDVKFLNMSLFEGIPTQPGVKTSGELFNFTFNAWIY